MTPHTISQPAGWAKTKGYANGMAAEGKLVFIAGQIGWNGQCRFEIDELTGQDRKGDDPSARDVGERCRDRDSV
jgi:hypothetical protein